MDMTTLLIIILLIILFGGGGYSWHTYNVNPQSGSLLGLLVIVCVAVLLVSIMRRGGPPVV